MIKLLVWIVLYNTCHIVKPLVLVSIYLFGFETITIACTNGLSTYQRFRLIDWSGIVVTHMHCDLNSWKRQWLYHGNDYSTWTEIDPPPSHDMPLMPSLIPISPLLASGKPLGVLLLCILRSNPGSFTPHIVCSSPWHRWCELSRTVTKPCYCSTMPRKT
jgi:hypothetical protein